MTFQLGSALLEACMLAVLSGGDTYGYVLTQSVKGKIEISESTLYPVMRRLQKGGYLETYDQPYQGRNRRYYHITEAGRQNLLEAREEWKLYKKKVDQILEEGTQNE